MSKIKVIRDILGKIISDIDANNTNISDSDAEEILGVLNKVLIPESKYSKYQACTYLGISRATFDNLVREGKIPKGRKEQGFKELFYYKKDLDDIKNKINNK